MTSTQPDDPDTNEAGQLALPLASESDPFSPDGYYVPPRRPATTTHRPTTVTAPRRNASTRRRSTSAGSETQPNSQSDPRPASRSGNRSGRCRRCGRALKDPVSVERGLGPICASKSTGLSEEQQVSEFSDHHIDEPITSGIILQRNEDGVSTNVPHFATHHSPDGFAFGYGGSGPADLALNAVEALLRSMDWQGARSEPLHDGRSVFRATQKLYQDFKWAFIATVPDGFGTHTIPYAQAKAWIEERLMTDDLDEQDLGY